MTAWSHLPNAKYIDLILADLTKNPGGWDAAYDAASEAASEAAYTAAWDAARNTANNAARNAAYYAAYDSVYYAANGAILALVAYDDYAWVLNEKPEDIQLLAVLTQEPQYVLLYPAVLALEKSKELS
jgi:hypothetical protein